MAKMVRNLCHIIFLPDHDPNQTDAETMQSIHRLLQNKNFNEINRKNVISYMDHTSSQCGCLPAIAWADPVIVWILLPKIDCRQKVASVKNVVIVIIMNPNTINTIENFHGNG